MQCRESAEMFRKGTLAGPHGWDEWTIMATRWKTRRGSGGRALEHRLGGHAGQVVPLMTRMDASLIAHAAAHGVRLIHQVRRRWKARACFH